VLKDLGEHPDGGSIQVLAGRYGPYVTYQKVNVTLPKDMQPEAVTLDQALTWLAAKQEKLPAPKKKAQVSAKAAPAKKTKSKKVSTGSKKRKTA
jgi:DNA topoisomerase-1